MESCLYTHHHYTTLTLPSPLSSLKPHFRFFPNFPTRPLPVPGALKFKARASASHCEFSSLNSPLEPRSLMGKFLSGVLQNHRQLFHFAVEEELKLLADDRDAAHARMVLGSASDEALLHRLEILPSKDWELESIHSLEVLDMIREHITTVTGLRANSSVTESWATTKVRQFLLAQVYVASVLYGYFLKSVSLRYHLEQNLSLANHDLHLGHWTALSICDMRPYGFKDVIFGRLNNMQSGGEGLIRQQEEIEDLKCYVMGFHPGSLQRCAKSRSKEAVNLVGSYSCALFKNEESGLVENDVILTSFSSLKRLVLEAVAFGSFLWETEDYIDNVYKLTANWVVERHMLLNEFLRYWANSLCI